jgi:homocysteine S-methyltransferase
VSSKKFFSLFTFHFVTMVSPITPFLKANDALVLDGGLATELEKRGHNLDDALWSARLLLEQPAVIQQVHLDYFWAGADCGISASYQATLAGLQARGLTVLQAIDLLRRSVGLVQAARAQFWQEYDQGRRACTEPVEVTDDGNLSSVRRPRSPKRLYPLVAASIGPYGAALADGSEYTGDYDLDEDALFEWHRQRWHVLARSGADLLACETIPSYNEARALLRLLRETPGVWAWFSFSCRDEVHISDGTPVSQCATLLAEQPQVTAIGVNCTPPRYIGGLIREITAVSTKPVIIYPNSGERYDPKMNQWVGLSDASEFGTVCREWRKAGAALIGGCCRTGPEHIQQIRDRFPVQGREASR